MENLNELVLAGIAIGVGVGFLALLVSPAGGPELLLAALPGKLAEEGGGAGGVLAIVLGLAVVAITQVAVLVHVEKKMRG